MHPLPIRHQGVIHRDRRQSKGNGSPDGLLSLGLGRAVSALQQALQPVNVHLMLELPS